MSRRPSRRCPRGSGIVRRSQRRAGSGGSLPRCMVQTCRGCLSNFAKSPLPPRTCRKACSATADSGREERYAMTCPWRHKHNPFHRKVRGQRNPERAETTWAISYSGESCSAAYPLPIVEMEGCNMAKDDLVESSSDLYFALGWDEDESDSIMSNFIKCVANG